jgi:hypothetical protein
MAHHDEEINGNIPKWLKWTLVAIDRVGFPIIAFIMMFYMAITGVHEMTTAIADNSRTTSTALAENTKSLVEFKAQALSFQTQVMEEHRKIMDQICRNGDKIERIIR